MVTTAIAMLVGIFAAYALARLNFRGKFLVLGLILGASMFPGVALVTPLFQLFTNIAGSGTYQALIIPNISFVLPLTVYILTAFFAEMPWELEEAARIDGCTPGQAFRMVMLPLAAPGAVHHRDPGLHLVLERVPAGQPAVRRQDPAGHRRDRQFTGSSRTRSRTRPSWPRARSSPYRW